MADNLDASSKAVPADLQITAVPDTNKDYFNFTIPNLKIDTNYSFQFQYVYADGTVGQWSPGYNVHTNTETQPNKPNIAATGGAGFIAVTWDGLSGSSSIQNIKRVDVKITNGQFGTGTTAYSFVSAGSYNIPAAAGHYKVELIAVGPSGITSQVSDTIEVDVVNVGETVQSPTNPTGFSVIRILGGVEVAWDGTYLNGTFTGFEAINIYAGTSATATSGTYIQVGAMTGNNVKNRIVIPVDGTYCRYNQPIYIHAAAVNKNGDVGTLQQNVAHEDLGARSAISTDLNDQIITNAKLVDDAVTAAKIATSAITETKIATDAVTTSKIVANAITADKITSSAITADKIATNAITATKILAGTIDVTKLAAGTISTDNLEAGIITSTSYLRAGTAGSARVEISSSAIGSVLAGLHVYNSAGTAVLKAPLSGGLEITGKITATSGSFTGDLYASNGLFKVESGQVTATSGTIGGWTIDNSKFASSLSNPKIEFDPSSTLPQIRVNGTGGTITIDATQGIKDSNGNFQLTPGGTLTLKGSIEAGSTISGATFSTTDSSNNYWNSTSFNMGTSSTYINYSGSTITMISGTTTSGSDTNSSPDGNGNSVSAITVNSRIVLSSSGLQLRGIPTLGDYTRYNYPYNYYTNTDANSANPNYGMGSAARLRTLIQDPYDHTVYRGFAVYYGQRSSAPGGTTGYVGDLWVSW